MHLVLRLSPIILKKQNLVQAVIRIPLKLISWNLVRSLRTLSRFIMCKRGNTDIHSFFWLSPIIVKKLWNFSYTLWCIEKTCNWNKRRQSVAMFHARKVTLIHQVFGFSPIIVKCHVQAVHQLYQVIEGIEKGYHVQEM